MSSAGSVSLELRLERTKFDQDLQKLQQSKVGAIPVKLKLDVKDFERQIKGLTGFLPELVIPVSLDTRSLKTQLAAIKNIEIKATVAVDKNAIAHLFEEIGREAIAGFNLGFGSDPGKAAADALVKSVKQQLQIQSPSRVFREIGRYAAAGLVQGLDSVSESQVKGVINRIEGYFKNSKMKVGLEFEKPQAPKFEEFKSTISLGGDGDITKNITSAIEKGFKNVKPQKNLFGSLTGLILSPVQQALQGAFLGIGLPIGQQFGQGIGRGIESQINQVVGSVDLLGEKIAAKLPGAIGAKIQKVSILKALFSQDQVKEAQKEFANFLEQVVGQNELLTEKLAQTTRNRQRQSARKQEAAQEAGRQYDRALIDSPRNAIVSEQLKASVQQAKKNEEDVQSELQDFRKNSRLRQSRPSEGLPQELIDAIQQGRKQIRELSQQARELRQERAKVEKQMEAALQSGDDEAAKTELKRRAIIDAGIAQKEKQRQDYKEGFAQAIGEARGIKKAQALGLPKELIDGIERGRKQIREFSQQARELRQERAKVEKQMEAALQSGDDEATQTALERQAIIDAGIAQKEKQRQDYKEGFAQVIGEARDIRKAQALGPIPEEERAIKEAELIKKLQAIASQRKRLEAQLQQSQGGSRRALSQLQKIGVDTSDITNTEKALSQVTQKGSKRINELSSEIEDLRSQRIKISEQLGAALQSGDDEATKTELKRLKILDADIAQKEKQIQEYVENYERVLAGAREDVNKAQAQLLQSSAFPEMNVEQVSNTIKARQKINLVAYKAGAGDQAEELQVRKGFLEEDLKQRLEAIGGKEGRGKAEKIRQELQKELALLNAIVKEAQPSEDDEVIDPEKVRAKNARAASAKARAQDTLGRLRLIESVLEPLRTLESEIKSLEPVIKQAQEQSSLIGKAVDQSLAAIEKEEKQLSELAKSKNTKKTVKKKNTAPQIYKDVVQQAAKLAGLGPIPEQLIPQLEASSEVAGRGDYNAQKNTYRIRPDLFKQLQTNDIDQISEEAISNIVHEIYHAFQHGFGKAIADNTGKPLVELTDAPTPSELLKLGDKIESSVAIQPDERKDLSRKLETDANVFQIRNTKAVTEQLKRQKYEKQALSLGGVAGAKISLTEVNKLIDDISAFLKQATELGVDVSEIRNQLITQVKNIRSSTDATGAKSVDLKTLTTDELKSVVDEYQRLLSEIGQIRAEIPVLIRQLETREIAPLQQERSQSPTTLKEDLSIQLQRPQLLKLAKDLGVTGVSKKKKSEVVDAILKSGATEDDIRAKLPKFRIPTQEIIGQATRLSQLTGEQLSTETKAAVDEISKQLKSVKSDKGASAEKLASLQQLLIEIDKLELAYIAAKAKALDDGVKNTLEGRIKTLQKQRVAATFEIKPLQPGAAKTGKVGVSQPQQVLDAEVEFERKALSLPSSKLPTPPPPPPPKPPKPPGNDEPIDPDESARRIREQSKRVNKASKILTRAARRQEKAYEKSVRDRIDKNSRIVDQALNQLEQETNEQVKEIEAEIAYQEDRQNRKTARKIRKIQQRQGLEDTSAPEVEKPVAEPKSRALSLKSLFGDLRGAQVEAVRKQAKALNQQAQILLTDIQAQIVVGENAQKEAAVVRQQIADNEKALQKILNTIKRANEGKEPALTPGDVQRLSGQAEVLDKQIDEDKQRLGGLEQAAARGNELKPVAKKLSRTTDESQALASQSSLSDDDLKKLRAANSETRELFDTLGQPPIPPRDLFDDLTTSIGGMGKAAFGAVKGFLAFAALGFIQNQLRSLLADSFKAYVELDRLKTALNFASGGSAGGAQNLAFVRKQVDDLKIPLKSSTEGFVGLAAAARGTALEGKGTRELFKGMAQASTVLSLSNEQTQRAFLALQQILSKGKVSAEEMRGQLAESGLAGAMGIAARAVGVTEQEFSRLLDTGQVLSQDFLPRFAKQLQAEFGDAAKDAAGNAQSAIFDLENSFLSLQQGIGEGISPAAVAGLNGLSAILKGLTAVSKELGFGVLAVTAALSVKMVAALKAVIVQLIATKAATGTLSGGLASLGQTVNNSFSAKLSVGIFAVLEVVNLLNQAVNTELVQSFDKAAKAAQRAAEESRKVFEKPKTESSNAVGRFLDEYVIKTLNSNFGSKITTFAEREQSERAKKQGEIEPVATDGVGRFLDEYLIGFLNMDVGPFKGGVPGLGKITTYGQYERDATVNDIQEQGLSISESLADARLLLAQFKTGKGEGGNLRAIDAQLKSVEEERAILQARIKREFVDKGRTVPSEFRQQLESQNLKFTKLNDQRSEAGKPLTLELNRTIQKINSINSQLEQLSSPDKIAALGGEAAADKQRENLKRQLEPLKQFRFELEAALGSLRIDPVRAFTQSLRQLNLALAESTEKNEQNFNRQREAIASTQLKDFSSNKFAARDAALLGAIAERDRNQSSVTAQQKAVADQDAAINAPEFQTTLRRLGVAPDASVAKIDDILKNTADEADKGILERLKVAREQRNRLSDARASYADSQLKVKQQVQDNSLFDIEDRTAKTRAKIQGIDNKEIADIRKAQEARIIVEEVAAEKITAIQLRNSQAQRKIVDAQLQVLREYYEQGSISAEEFAKRERELTLEQTDLEKQEAENRLAVRQATLQRRLKEIEVVNRKAENALALTQSGSTREAKEQLLASGLTQPAQDAFALEQNKIEQEATNGRIQSIKNQIAQTKQLRQEGLLDAREAMEREMSLNEQLAAAQVQLVDLKIAAEEKYREIVERNLQRIVQAESDRFRNLDSQLNAQKVALDLYNQSLERTKTLGESRFNLNKALSDAAISPLEIRRDNASRALELSRKLKDDNLDPGVRSEVNRQLEQLGFGSNEIQILQQRSQIEDEIAAKKLEALKLEQGFQKEALRLDLQRQKIASETAVYDAQSAQLAAAKAKIEAEGALRVAIIRKDDVAIQSAQIGLEIANRESELADKRLASALENLGIQGELAVLAMLAQEATQKIAIDQQLAADAARKQASSLEKVESRAAKQEENKNYYEERSGINNATVRRVYSGKAVRPKRKQDNETQGYTQDEPSVWGLQLPRHISVNQLPDLKLNKGENLFEGYMRYRDSIKSPDKTALLADAAKVSPAVSDRTTQFSNALKIANQEVVQRLDKLIESLSTAVNTPRSLTVQTPNPVDDAAKILSAMQRGQVAAAGL